MLEVPVDPTTPVVLGAPLAGGPWAAVYHSDWERGHRRVFYTVDGVTRLPGRYTIDFVKLDDEGRTALGDVDVVGKALGYGADVLAVSDATVAALRDDMPEAARVSARVKHRQEDAAGNYVSLDLGGGRFAVYEHLKPGSVPSPAGRSRSARRGCRAGRVHRRFDGPASASARRGCRLAARRRGPPLRLRPLRGARSVSRDRSDGQDALAGGWSGRATERTSRPERRRRLRPAAVAPTVRLSSTASRGPWPDADGPPTGPYGDGCGAGSRVDARISASDTRGSRIPARSDPGGPAPRGRRHRYGGRIPAPRPASRG